MNRCLAFILAIFFATITVSSAVATPADWIHFTIEPRGNGEIYATFRDESRGRNDSNWSSGLRPSELIGLDVAALRAAGTRPLRFAITREAGRLDCAGTGGSSRGAGNCTFTADPGFTQLLASRGIGRPTRDQAFGLMAIDARREVIEAVAAARYPTPTIDDLMALTALGITGRYISDLARAGYRPRTIDTLIEFKALGITPEWIAGFTRIGYGNLPGHRLVELKALDVSPQFIAGFERIGRRNLPVDTLVQFKALGVTPEFVERMERWRGARLSDDQLVQLRALGFDR